mmetsp:Transcript_8008/g.19656  ORF Transcript_8008/g.19656 Transcript_8008/m.19656 type:complete len:118 (+) Transcript_8008:1277-1630(+)|eukprot:CAMPEP_0202337312 /NCGR_PEP_ID=MMETSP1126-20121109/38_1 /ASSEMBLY_ACC=CAM_ASM_000457 /TAXON_ID=3047 /ORGANISM="Dunaliella tertiolecta, Strain CCMP1320" /LENGTH=117 /DNA_ID=CAMNT_0048927465 /DNA_START=34 /DNA_END=387 /DNA_ORIENTATION=+
MQCAKPITQYSAVAKQAPCRPITHTRVRCCASASKNTINWGAAALAAVTVLAGPAPWAHAARTLTKEEMRKANPDFQGSLQGIPGSNGSDSKRQEEEMRAALAARIAASKAPQVKAE